MPQCDLTAAFMAGIEEFFPIATEVASTKKWKTTLGDLLKLSEWDKISDGNGSWHGLKKRNVLEPTEPELQMRMQYALQIGVNQLNGLLNVIATNKTLRTYSINLSSPKDFEKSLAKLQEELEYYEDVALIKGDRYSQRTVYLGRAKIVSGHLQFMFECIGNRKYAAIGRTLARIFSKLALPKDMALKTSRKLLSL